MNTSPRDPATHAPELPEALNQRVLQRLVTALGEIREEALRLEAAHAADIESIEPACRASARNLPEFAFARSKPCRIAPTWATLWDGIHGMGQRTIRP